MLGIAMVAGIVMIVVVFGIAMEADIMMVCIIEI
jgi:hypothetical protein